MRSTELLNINVKTVKKNKDDREFCWRFREEQLNLKKNQKFSVKNIGLVKL